MTTTNARKKTPSHGIDLARIPDVAAFLAVSRSKVYKLLDDGTLPSIRLGRSRRVPWAAVHKLVQDSLAGA